MQTNTRLIPLTQGQFAIVDSVDYKWTMEFKWHAVKIKTTYGWLWYAKRTTPRPLQRSVFLHREIAKRASLPESPKYDHRDRNGLNNSRQNIRPATSLQNTVNSTKSAGKTSQYKGTTRQSGRKNYRVTIAILGKRHHLGMFKDEREAHEAYLAAARKAFGEFASGG